MKQKQAEIEFAALNGCTYTKETLMAQTGYAAMDQRKALKVMVRL